MQGGSARFGSAACACACLYVGEEGRESRRAESKDHGRTQTCVDASTPFKVSTNTRATIRRRLRHHPRRPRRFSACAGYMLQSEKEREREGYGDRGRKRRRVEEG